MTTQAQITALQATLAEATAQAAALTPSTTTTPPPPPATGTFTAAPTSATQIKVTWSGVTPASLARNGTDSTGTGPWSTTQATPPLPVFGAAGSFTFNDLVPGVLYTFTLNPSSGTPLTHTATIPATTTTPPPVVTPPPVTTPPATGSGVPTVSTTNPSGKAPPAVGSIDPVTGWPWKLVDDFAGSSLGSQYQGFYTGSNPAGDSPFNAANGSVGGSLVTLKAGPSAPGGDGGTGFNTFNFGAFSAAHVMVMSKRTLGQGYVKCFGLIGQGYGSSWPPEFDFDEDLNGQNSDTSAKATQATVHTGSGNNQFYADETDIDNTAWHISEGIYNGDGSYIPTVLSDGKIWGTITGAAYGTGANNLGLPMIAFFQLEDGDGTNKTGKISLVTLEIDWIAIACPPSAFHPAPG